MSDFNMWAAVASAIAAIGSVSVAFFSYRQQRAAARASDIDKNIDRLIALASRTNSLFSSNRDGERSFDQVAEVTNSVDAAASRILNLESKLSLTLEEVNDISNHFIDHLSYGLLEAMRSPKPPPFKPNGYYSVYEVDYINQLWRRSCRFILERKRPDQPD